MKVSKLSFVLASAAMLTAVPVVRSSNPAELDPAPPADDVVSGGLVTLYAHDDLRSSFSFSRGGFGGAIHDGELILDDADVIFHTLQSNHLSYGFVRHHRVDIVDLGPLVVDPVVRATDDAPKPSISIFHSLFLQGSVFHYRGPIKRTHRLTGFDNFVHGPMSDGTRSIEPRVGHTYVLRFKADIGHGGADGLVKIEVIEFVPDSRLTFRWARL